MAEQQAWEAKSPTQVLNELNQSFAKMFVLDNDGSLKPHVCIVCDKFVKANDICNVPLNDFIEYKHQLQTEAAQSLDNELKACYIANAPSGYESTFENVLLSPRSTLKLDKENQLCSVTMCNQCCKSLRSGTIPKFAIANGHFVGTPPECITSLTDIELAFIAPVRTHGYAFVFTGGFQKQLSSTLSYYKRNVKSIVTCVAQLDILGLTKDGVKIAFVGDMTIEQKKIARKRSTIRSNKIKEAVLWLTKHNPEWIGFDFERLKEALKEPQIVMVEDSSKTVTGHTGSNIESVETKKVFFPDSSIQESFGGQENVEDFLRLVIQEKVGRHGATDVYAQANINEERVHEYKDKNLMHACLIQFPYGRGGLTSEERYKPDNYNGRKYDLTHKDFIDHLSRISQGHFHYQLFQLQLYNYFNKNSMVQRACIRTRAKGNAEAISEGMTEADFLDVLKKKANREHVLSEPSKKFLSAIDAVGASAPHSNQAARKARNKCEVLQHHFGLPTWFLTVSPDDEHNILLQVYSWNDLDHDLENWQDIFEYDDDEMAKRAGERLQLRIQYPGITSWIFESQIELLLQHVIGWDTENGKPASKCGLFGHVVAYLGAVEEQGRKSLHIHWLIWCAHLNTYRNELHMPMSSGTRKSREAKRKRAESILCNEIDRLSSCGLLDQLTEKERRTVFAHECLKRSTQNGRKRPTPASAQQLRNLRCKEGAEEDESIFSCDVCHHKWSSNDIILQYLRDVLKLKNLSEFPDRKTKRLKVGSMVCLQIEQDYESTIGKAMFEATYNNHNHTTNSCFKTKHGKSANGHCVECRYRYPKPFRKTTNILNTGMKVKWFKIDGSHEVRFVRESAPKRAKADVFQNQSAKAIGQASAIFGNTNLSFLQEGPVAKYITKYVTKNTQDDDGEDFKRICSIAEIAMSRMRSETESNTEPLSEGDRLERNRKEAVKRVLAVAFLMQAGTTVGAPLAAYLVRNKSRFLYSHEMQLCPIIDMEKLLHGKEVSRYLVKSRLGNYMTNDALDYLCRPEAFGDMSAFEYFGSVAICRGTKPNADKEQYPFLNSDKFEHPSWNEAKGQFAASAKLINDHSKRKLVQIWQYSFLDTSKFNGCILDGNTINENTEAYSLRALLLMKPFRDLEELRMSGAITKTFVASAEKAGGLSEEQITFLTKLKTCGSYTEVFVQYIRESEINGTTKHIEFLQNIQNSAYNCFRRTDVPEELERKTCAYRGHQGAAMEPPSTEDGNEQAIDDSLVDDLIAFVNESTEGKETTMNTAIPKVFSTTAISSGGSKDCKANVARMLSPLEQPSAIPWLEISEPSESDDEKRKRTATNVLNELNAGSAPTAEELMSVIVSRRHRLVNGGRAFSEGETVMEANGSADSIIEWSEKGKFDESQKRAFEILTASFVLTFFDGDGTHIKESELGYDTKTFTTEKDKLELLADVKRRGSEQLIAFMHGPGGSGKSWVVDLVMVYAKEFTSHFEGFVFDKRTIVVTAMTGCAATLLNGETAHGALNLNGSEKQVTVQESIEWSGCRLVIVDEISFAGIDDIRKMSSQLSKYMGNVTARFGGVHILFVGDMRQLEPIGKNPLYHCPGFQNIINCSLPLNGMHRFKNDIEWGKLLRKFRDGTVEKRDIRELNKKIWIGHSENQTRRMPSDTKYCTFRNVDRDAINTAVFEKVVAESEGDHTTGLLVFASDIKLKNSSSTFCKLNNWNLLWNNVAESQAKFKTQSKRMDPVLKIYRGMPVMLTENTDVASGIANGTKAYVHRVVLNEGESYSTSCITNDGTRVLHVKAVLANQIKFIELKHDNDRIPDPLFRLSPKEFTFQAKFPDVLTNIDRKEGEFITWKALQLPFISNIATTGHKLQGSSVDHIFVHQWTTKKSWNYVVLSRPRTVTGMLAREELPDDIDMYKIPDALRLMMENLAMKEPSGSAERRTNNDR